MSLARERSGVSPRWRALAGRFDRPAARRVARAVETVVFGGERRERLLSTLLRAHYSSLRRRQWFFSEELPHYFDQRITASALLFGGSPTPLLRGFLALQVVEEHDIVLDVGTGDGFFARRLFAERAAHVDAIDVDPEAIAHASRRHSGPNVEYHLIDATREPFPRPSYDVVVFDGAIGHLAREDSSRLLARIRESLAPGGMFVGSESLGDEGHDHLQFFAGAQELGAVLREVFPIVEVSEISYRLGNGLVRREAFWRCAIDTDRSRRPDWQAVG